MLGYVLEHIPSDHSSHCPERAMLASMLTHATQQRRLKFIGLSSPEASVACSVPSAHQRIPCDQLSEKERVVCTEPVIGP
jgi:hypothetical protein